MTREERRERMEKMLYSELRERQFVRDLFGWLFAGTFLLFVFAAIVGKLMN
jgi:hypothetical protein